MAKAKGAPKSGGRKAGTPNKNNAELREMILQALSDVGGVTYLSEQANKSPTAFLSLIGKVLPLTIAGDANAPLGFSIVVNHVKPDSK